MPAGKQDRGRHAFHDHVHKLVLNWYQFKGRRRILSPTTRSQTPRKGWEKLHLRKKEDLSKNQRKHLEARSCLTPDDRKIQKKMKLVKVSTFINVANSVETRLK